MAAERGFAAEEGLDLRLVRETSWANIRDRLIVGHFDAAHMLAPMTIASTLGIGHVNPLRLRRFLWSRRQRHHRVASISVGEMASVGCHCRGLSGRSGASAQTGGHRTRAGRAPSPSRLGWSIRSPAITTSCVIGWPRPESIRTGTFGLVVIPPPFLADAFARARLTASVLASPGIPSPWTPARRHCDSDYSAMAPEPRKGVRLPRRVGRALSRRTCGLLRALYRAAVGPSSPKTR